MAQVRHVQTVEPESQAQMAAMLGFSLYPPTDKSSPLTLINQAALIQILRENRNGKGGLAALLLATLPKTPEGTQALWDALAAAKVSDDPYREGLLAAVVSALAQTGETGWEDGIVAQLPQMTQRAAQLNIAQTLKNVGRADGWPIVKAAIVDDNPHYVQSGLYHVEYFDGLRNPDGGKPIDVVAELRQIAGTAPEQTRQQIQAKADRIAQDKQHQ